MSEGVHWCVRNEEQRRNLMNLVRSWSLPFMAKVGEVVHPKTRSQINYAHSLCGALAAAKQVSPDLAKRDAKVAFGVVTVHHSVVTGDRTARLVSFADYSKEQMAGFLSAMEAFMDEESIPYTPSEWGDVA